MHLPLEAESLFDSFPDARKDVVNQRESYRATKVEPEPTLGKEGEGFCAHHVFKRHVLQGFSFRAICPYLSPERRPRRDGACARVPSRPGRRHRGRPAASKGSSSIKIQPLGESGGSARCLEVQGKVGVDRSLGRNDTSVVDHLHEVVCLIPHLPGGQKLDFFFLKRCVT